VSGDSQINDSFSSGTVAEAELQAKAGAAGASGFQESSEVPAVAVFVANLPFHSTAEDIEACLAPVGEVARIRLGRINGRSAGFATLSMADPKLDDEAIAFLNQHELGGRQLRAKRSEPKRKDYSVLYIAGWPGTATLQDIQSVIEGAGVSTHVDVPSYDAGTRVGKFGFLRFSSPEAGSEALEKLRALTVKGRPLLVNGSAVKPKDASIFLGNLPLESLPQGSVIETRNALAATFESLTGYRPTFIRLHSFPDGSPKNSAHVKLADAESVKQILEAYRDDPYRFRIGEHQLKLQKVQPQVFSANNQSQQTDANQPW